MRHLFYVLSLIFTSVVCIFVVLTVLIKAVISLRRRIPIRVNCWFCNTWTKVQYDNRNSFECPTCLQYNGFTKGGDYNKYIPEQHEESLNKYPDALDKTRHMPARNGLCSICNYNQHLQVTQLAQFEPRVEENYDVEIEHFRQQLEKSYQLCPKCEEVLHETIYRQNAFIIGNRVKQLKNNSISSLLGQEIVKINSKESVPLSLISYSIVLFALLILVNLLTTFDYSDNNLRKLLHPRAFHVFKHFRYNVQASFSKIVDMHPAISEINEYFGDFSKYVTDKVSQVLPLSSFNVDNGFFKTVSSNGCLIDTVSTSIAGLLLQIVFAFFGHTKIVTKSSQVVSWLIIVLLILFPLKKTYGAVGDLTQIALATYIIYTMLATNVSTPPTPHQQKKLKKRKRNIRKLNRSETFSDFSDTDIPEPRHKSFNSTLNSTDTAISDCDITTPKSFSPIELHDSTITNTPRCFDNENDCRRSCVSSDTNRVEQNGDLNASLSNLYLSGAPSGDCCKQLLSPPKLKSVMQNPWTAGGFWHSSYPCAPPTQGESGESRSSSQSSGFISQTHEKQCFNSLPASRANSCHSAEDKASVLSEPMYVNTNGLGRNPKMKNTFFPTLRANQTLYIQAGAPAAANGFYMKNQAFWGNGTSTAVVSEDSAFRRSDLFKNPEARRGDSRGRFSFSEV